MAVLYITGYANLVKDARGTFAPVGEEPAIETQTVAVGASTQSNQFNKETRILRLLCDIDFHQTVGADTTTTTTDPLFIANTEYWLGLNEFVVTGDGGLKLAARSTT